MDDSRASVRKAIRALGAQGLGFNGSFELLRNGKWVLKI